MAGTCELNSGLHQLDEDNIGEPPDFINDMSRHRVIDIYHRHGPTARPLPSQLHAGDVDPVLPEQGPNRPDDSWHVQVREDQEVPFRNGFQTEFVDPDDPGFPTAEERPGHLTCTAIALDRNS